MTTKMMIKPHETMACPHGSSEFATKEGDDLTGNLRMHYHAGAWKGEICATTCCASD